MTEPDTIWDIFTEIEAFAGRFRLEHPWAVQPPPVEDFRTCYKAVHDQYMARRKMALDAPTTDEYRERRKEMDYLYGHLQRMELLARDLAARMKVLQ